MESLLFQAFVYLSAAVIAVPIAKRLGLGSVLGYLLAGIIIGPVIGLVGTETKDMQHFAEFGVVMMLFLVGLELEPAVLWRMRFRLTGLGGFQLGITTALITGFCIFFGLAWQTSLAIGLIFALSSTAIVLQTLSEKGLMKSAGGRSTFSVLLFQDIAVIPMLALLPLLATTKLTVFSDRSGQTHSYNLVAGLPGWATALIILAAIATVILAGHFLTRPIFRFIAKSQLREIFTAAALLLVISISLLMELVGLSPALGAFLAGVVLANNEYRHELESDIEPFKGLLLGLFFITVGAGIDFEVLFADFTLIFLLALGLIVLKASVLLSIAKAFKIPRGDNWLFALGLAQAGEFAFVLINFSVGNAVLDLNLAKTLSLIVGLSMLLTPALFILYERLIAPRMINHDERENDEIDDQAPAIIAGHGRFGQIVNRMLLTNGIKSVVLDHQSDLVDGMRRFGLKGFYGDATRPDLLMAAGLQEARVLVVAIDDRERTTKMVEYARRERPDLHIIARAFDRPHCYALFNAGASDVVRETFDSSIRAGRYALENLGLSRGKARQVSYVFYKHDRASLKILAKEWDPTIDILNNTSYMALSEERNRLLDEAIQNMEMSEEEE
jgi:monovalent cation:H+ antiporter-2, CPA2 family